MKKGVKQVRPTLAEIAEQPGRFVVVTYEGFEGGGFNIPAPRPRFANDNPEDLAIEPFKPKVIDELWLKDGRFEVLYNKFVGIKVSRSDSVPPAVDLYALPPELYAALTPYRRNMAMRVATEPWSSDIRDRLVLVEQRGGSERTRVENLKYEVKPWLMAVLYYEQHLGNRPEVIKTVQGRIKQIDNMQPFDLRS